MNKRGIRSPCCESLVFNGTSLWKALYVPGDFNGDGRTDLVIQTASGSYWYFSNGDGTWTVHYVRPDLNVDCVLVR